MKKLVIGAAASLIAAAGALAGTGPADARPRAGYVYHGPYYGGWRYHGDYAGAAVIAGLTGLAIGASLAQPGYYYPGPAYGYAGYYGPPPAYYVGPSYYGWYQGCRREWVWNPHWRTYRLVRACY